MWKYTGASVIGSGHIACDLPCQDVSVVLPLGSDALLLVVADGAGSAKYAAEGAARACATVVEEVCRYATSENGVDGVTNNVVDEWISAVAASLRVQATELGVPVREFACTLVVALVSARTSHFVQIGDGAIIVSRNGSFAAATWPDNGEYANETSFVTDEYALQKLQVHTNQPPVDEVAVISDGLQMLVLTIADRSVYSPFFDRMFRPLRLEPPGQVERLQGALAEYLLSEGVCRRTEDDKSLLLATRIESQGSAPSAE